MIDYELKSAVTSGDGLYRYELRRSWASDRHERVVWVMLNPSTADGMTDDPTVRRCVALSDDHGYSEIVIVNLFAYRATNPRALIAIRNGEDEQTSDPIGPANDRILDELLAPVDFVDTPDVVLAWGAWGAHPALSGQAERVRRLTDRKRVYHLGDLTNDGQPRHPLYLPGDVEWERFW